MVVTLTSEKEKTSVDVVDANEVQSDPDAKSGRGPSRRASAPSAPGRLLPPRAKPVKQLSSSLTTALEGHCSREGLRQEIRNRRSSLLPKEVDFLRDLLEGGNEEELTVAREKLSDTSLFFDHQIKSSENPNGLTTNSSIATLTENVPDRSLRKTLSDKVEKYRQSRRESTLHGKMWKAHENGLAVTIQGSRRSMMLRSSRLVSSSISSSKFSTGSDGLEDVDATSGADTIIRLGAEKMLARSSTNVVPDDSSGSRDLPSSAASSVRRSLNGSRSSFRPKRMVIRPASNSTHLGEGIEVFTSSMIGDSDFTVSSTGGSLDGAAASSSGKGGGVTMSTFRHSSSTLDVIPSFDDTYRPELRKVPSHLRETDDTALGNKNVCGVLSDKRLDSDSWDASSEGQRDQHYDPWNILKDEYVVEYLGGDTLPFRILGTSADDVDATPHVLSPPLLESLQNFFPYAISEENFWMRYSLVKHGASLHSMLPHIRGARYTVMAVETTDGEVFGSFTGTAWKNNGATYFGSGEAFLWRMRQSRNTPCFSVIDQAHIESELDVYPWTGDNDCVQLCSNNTIAIGGGSMDGDEVRGDYGFGFALEKDLLHGTTNHCATFASPPLSKIHKDGSPFEIVNVEVWTTTPSYTLEDAEKLQFGKLFLERHATI